MLFSLKWWRLLAEESLKILAKVTLQEESMFSCGYLREHFKFDILADSMEQVPVLVVVAVLRIHHMLVEVFNGCPDGRVISEVCHCGGGRGGGCHHSC